MLTIVKLVVIESLVQMPSQTDDLISLFLLDLYHLPLQQILREPRFTISVLKHLLTNEFFGKSFDYRQVHTALACCGKYGRLDMMKKLFEYAPSFGWEDSNAVFSHAVERGELKMMEWLWDHQRHVCDIGWVVGHVVQKGDVETFRFLQTRDLVDVARVSEYSLGRCRQREMVEFLLDKSNASLKLQETAVIAAGDGNHDLLRCLWDQELLRCGQCVLEAALKHGNMDIVGWLENVPTNDATGDCCGNEHVLQQESLNRSCVPDQDGFLSLVMRNGRLDGLKWVLNRFPLLKVNGNLLIWSSMYGDRELLQWVLDQLSKTGGCEEWMYGVALDKASCRDQSLWSLLVDCGCSLRGLVQALANGVPEVMNYYRGHDGVESLLIRVADAGFRHCDDKLLHTVKSLVESLDGYNAGNFISKAATYRNGVGLLKWCGVKDQPVEIQWKALQSSIRNDRVDVTKYLMQQVTAETLALFGDPDEVKWWLVDAVSNATKTRDYSMFKCLVDLGVTTLTKAVIAHAGKEGWTDLLELMHEHRVDGFTARTMNLAAKYGHLNAVRFLHEHRVEGCTTAAMDDAAGRGHLQVVQFLHEHRHEGCTKRAMNSAAANGFLQVVQFLHDHRDEGCDKKAMDVAARRGHLRVVEFLHERRCEGCSIAAMHSAAARGLLNVVKFLDENRPEVKSADQAINRAGSKGHVRVVKYLKEHGYKCDWSGSLWRHWRVVQYLWIFEDARAHAQQALEFACCHCRWDVMQWLVANVKQNLDFERALVKARAEEINLHWRYRYRMEPIISCLEMQLHLQRSQTNV